MREVYVCVPTALKAHVPEQLKKWANQGYKIALFVDPGPVDLGDIPIALLMMGTYPGIWRAWNALAKAVMACGADVAVLIGDDMDPDPNKNAQELAEEYLARFPEGFGVMQPCGDPQGMGLDTNSASKESVPAAARICGSPWVGRGWVHRAYWGEGPVNGNYWAFYSDEEMKLVAERRGLLWMRPDVSQFHRHWSWQHMPKQPYHERNQKRWEADKALFESRRPGLDGELIFLREPEAMS
jgi:hypothetical protein